MISKVLILISLLPMIMGEQNDENWKQLDNDYFSMKVPSGWVFSFGGEDGINPYKRNIRVKNDKGERVEYELGTLTWDSGTKDFTRIMDAEVRSFRKTSGETTFMDEVVGQIPEASWPDWLSVVKKEKGGKKGTIWRKYLLKGECEGFSAETGPYTKLVWEYKLFLEHKGMVYAISVTIPDKVRSSSKKYNEMAGKIIDSFSVK